jgi:uncharacterized surface protein with fasciclin (FAS1) repeats
MTVVLVVASLSSAACPQPDQLRKAAKAADTMAASINAMILAKRELAQQGRITPEEELKLTQALFALNEAVTVFTNQVKNSKSWDESVKTALTTLFADVTAALDQLNTQGVLNITNPEAKQKLTGIIASLNAAVAIIKAVLT